MLRVAVTDNDDDDTAAGADTGISCDRSQRHPLVSLLARCNSQVAAVGQPTLYGQRTAAESGGDGTKNADSNEDAIASAFHVSVAWTLSDSIHAWTEPTEQAYAAWKQSQRRERGTPLRIYVDGVKVKIGNVVSDIPLAASERRAKRARTAAGVSYGPRKKLLGLY